MVYSAVKRIAILLVSMTFSMICLAKDTLTVGWADWPPHQTLDKSNHLTGANIDLVNEIFKRAGFKVEYQQMPWKRNLLELEAGRVDVAMSAGITPEREKYALFSKNYLKLEYNVLFVRKEDKDKLSNIKTLKDIIPTDLKIGVTIGSSYSDDYEALLKNPDFTKHLDQISDFKSNVRKLMSKRIDGFISDELTGAATIKELGFENSIQILFYLYGEEDAKSYLMFSRKTVTEDDVKKIDAAMESMRADGTYQKILSKYQLK